MNDTEQSTEQAPANTTSDSRCQQGSYCKPHISLYIAIIALALAAYAAFNTTAQDNSAMQTQLNNLEHQVSNINQQLETLNQAVQNNRDNLVQNKLKKALENIRDISGIAEEGSKAAIAKVEDILQSLTTLGEQLMAPAETETSTTTEATSATPTIEATTAKPQSATDTTTAPNTDESTTSETPAPAAKQATVSEPEVVLETPTDSKPAPAASNTTEPAKATAEIDRSAPQAF